MNQRLYALSLALATAFSLASISGVQGQIFNSVTFEDIEPDVVGGGTFRGYTLQNSGNARSLRYSGTITEINTATFVDEVVFDIAGSGFSLFNQVLDQLSDFNDTFDFSGFIPVETLVNGGDTWTFGFREIFDDSDDGLADASVDITFDWSTEAVPQPTVSDLGVFNLNQGVYPRQNQIGSDYPYGVVPFEVDADGEYTLRVDWLDTDTGNSFDGFLYVLDEPFEGSDVPAFTSNDDFLTTATSQLTTALEAGIEYFALLTTFSPSPINPAFEGSFSVSSFDGGNARVVAVPEPSGLLVIGCCAFAILARRRV